MQQLVTQLLSSNQENMLFIHLRGYFCYEISGNRNQLDLRINFVHLPSPPPNDPQSMKHTDAIRIEFIYIFSTVKSASASYLITNSKKALFPTNFHGRIWTLKTFLSLINSMITRPKLLNLPEREAIPLIRIILLSQK